jgi:lysophospholipase L1-like esterase
MEIYSDILLTSLFAAAMTLLLAFWVAETIVRKAHERYVDIYKTFPVHPEDIVMLGDSITDLTRWHELIPGISIKNRGISGDTLKGVLQRLDLIISGQPLAVFILIGTNDLPWYVFTSNRVILQRYEAMLKRFRQESPQTRVYVQSILPRSWRYARRIRIINARLKDLAGKYGCTYVDLFSSFADKHGAIRREFSNDYLHLKASGYRTWVQLLQPYLDEILPLQTLLKKKTEQKNPVMVE